MCRKTYSEHFLVLVSLNCVLGGYCEFYKDRLDAEADHISALQSWGPELRYFTKLQRRPIDEGDCDIVIEKPTYIMKIDASAYKYM